MTPDPTLTINNITAQTLTYLPAALAGIQAAEAAAPTAPGASKLAAVLAGIQAGAQTAESIPVPQVQGVAAMISLSVTIFNLLQAFRHHTPAAA